MPFFIFVLPGTCVCLKIRTCAKYPVTIIKQTAVLSKNLHDKSTHVLSRAS